MQHFLHSDHHRRMLLHQLLPYRPFQQVPYLLGQEAKEDFHSGTQAAAAGGFTRVVTMANTNPVVDNAALVRGLQKQAELTGVVKVEFIGAVSKGLEGKKQYLHAYGHF